MWEVSSGSSSSSSGGGGGGDDSSTSGLYFIEIWLTSATFLNNYI